MNLDTSPYRALHDFLLKIAEGESEARLQRKIDIPGQAINRDYPTEKDAIDFEGGSTASQSYMLTSLPPKGKSDLLAIAISLDWKPEGGPMAAKDIAHLLMNVQTLTNPEGKFNRWIRTSEELKSRAYKLLPKDPETGETRLYQYN